MADPAAGLDAPDVVDLVAEDSGTAEVALVIVHHQPWDRPAEQAELLLAKVNSYLTFALDGGLVETFPQHEGRTARIQLDCSYQPVAEVAEVTESCRAMKDSTGIGFRVNVID